LIVVAQEARRIQIGLTVAAQGGAKSGSFEFDFESGLTVVAHGSAAAVFLLALAFGERQDALKLRKTSSADEGQRQTVAAAKYGSVKIATKIFAPIPAPRRQA
jgi:hypothetical protein